MGRGISFLIFGRMYLIDCWLTVMRRKEGTEQLFLRVVIEEVFDQEM